MPGIAQQSGWISISAGQRRLTCGRQALLALVAAGRISSRTVPGSRPMILAADVDRICRESTRYAMPNQTEGVACGA
jgi:hypothetical protein